jgi:putative DNA primase/helicase
VAPLLRARFPDTVLIILADNDTKPDRDTNPGVTAATAAARAANALMAIPPEPGDMNDLAASRGLAAVAACIATAAPIPPIPPTYPLPTLSPEAARAQLDSIVGNFMTDVAAYWSGTAASPYEDDAVLPDMAAMAATPAPAGHAWI